MKRFLITSVLAAIIAAGSTSKAQDYSEEYLGLPGDNLNLYAVMKLFQESETLEGFERSLNDENSRINNLDLNGDNYIDYIRVVDYVDNDVHTIVLQALLDRNETQDVAVFTVQKFRDGSVQIQLTGDETLYGRNYIIEPIFGETPNPGYLGRSGRNRVTVVHTPAIEIAAWPLVRFIFLPDYTIWHSSWYWGYYPSYWHPWRPWYYHYYYGYHYHWYPHYYDYYRRWNYHRYARWDDFYYNRHRTWSRSVSLRVQSGDYRTTYSRPDSRRDGEALFVKSHPDRSLRSSAMSTGSDQGRRSVSQSAADRQATGTTSSTSRRSNSTVTNRTDVDRSSSQSSGTTRRSTTTVTNRSTTNPTEGQYSGTRRNSGTTVTNRSDSNPASGQNSSAPRRANTTVNDRERTTTSAGQSAGTSRRSPAPVADRPVTSTSRSQGTTTAPSSGSDRGRSATSASQSSAGSRRSPATISQRPSSGSSSQQSASSPRSSRGSSSSVGSSARRSSSGSTKASSGSKESGKSKESESSNSSRRK